MKIHTILYSLIVLLASWFGQSALAQSSCPVITGSSMSIVKDNGNGTSLYQERFSFANPTSGKKSINVVVKCGGAQVLSQCFDASSSAGSYVTDSFVCQTQASLPVTFNSYTGNTNCSGTFCNSVTLNSPLFVGFYDTRLIVRASVLYLRWRTEADFRYRYEVLFRAPSLEFRVVEKLRDTLGTLFEVALPARESGYFQLRSFLQNGDTVLSPILYFQKPQQERLVIFPVPAKSVIGFRGLTLPDHYVIESAQGATLSEGTLHADSMDISFLSPGIYFLRTDKSATTCRFIKIE